jgi:selenocysteine lyase/cysteine desulfurase
MTTALDQHFAKFRKGIVGDRKQHEFPFGKRPIVYADWTASGRLYEPIESYLANVLGPYVANTHTETTTTGTLMTQAYHEAHRIVKRHVNASKNDVLLFSGFGMTSAINKLQRMLGLRVHEKYAARLGLCQDEKALVVITHMEHHSNQTTWNECCCDVKIINRTENGLPDLSHLDQILLENKDRKLKIGSFSACSNVTGIQTPYHEMAAIMHRHGGYCFVDFAASAPYVNIDMHPSNPLEKLDAIFFSPHKFLGGVGASGVLVFDKSLYTLKVPDQPGGGTVMWTNPWGEQQYHSDIEIREDGGTPGFLQAIKAALAILLKEDMGLENIHAREDELKSRLIEKLSQHPKIHILESEQKNRLGIVSFYSLNMHHNLLVRILNDRFGIQSRGGCSCAGTYGHILLKVDREKSKSITEKISLGDLSEKPGWVRISLHPTTTLEEVDFIASSVHKVIDNYDLWRKDYRFDPATGDYRPLQNETAFDLKTNFSLFSRRPHQKNDILSLLKSFFDKIQKR